MPRHYMVEMDIIWVDCPPFASGLPTRLGASFVIGGPLQCTLFLRSIFLLNHRGGPLHVDPNHVWVTPRDSGGGETAYDVDTCGTLFWGAQGGVICIKRAPAYYECGEPAH